MVASRRSRVSLWLCALSAVFILYGTTIPFRFFPDRRIVIARWHRLTFNPLYPSLGGRRASIPDALQNILLFLPFGIFGAAALDESRPLGRRVLVVVAAGAALSTTVEGLQLIDAGRNPSFADVVSNTIGTALGAFVSRSALGALVRRLRSLTRIGAMDPAACYPLVVGVALLCVAAWVPFDATIDLNLGFRKLRALGRDPWQADGPMNDILQMVRFVMVTLLAATWLRDLGVRRSVAGAVAACTLLATLLELSQMLIGSRIPGLVDLSFNVAGALIGGLLYRPLRRVPSRGAWWVLIAVSTWVAAVSPILGSHREMFRLPFWRLSFGYARVSVAMIGRVVEVMLTTFPLGFATAWMARRTARAPLVVWTIAVATVFGFSVAGLVRWSGASNATLLDVLDGVLGALGGAWAGRAGWRWFLAHAEALDVPSARHRRRVMGPVAR